MQSHRSTKAQRELEREKLRTAEQGAVLAEARADQAQERNRVRTYRRDQVLPFLESLHAALDASYGAAYIPEHFPALGGRFPQIRSHADTGLLKWHEAILEMSKHRMQLFLS